MSIFELAMQDPYIKKQILIQFGFGEVSPVKVERWIKKNYPYKFYELRRNAKSEKIVPFSLELSNQEERNRLLDIEESYRKFFK